MLGLLPVALAHIIHGPALHLDTGLCVSLQRRCVARHMIGPQERQAQRRRRLQARVLRHRLGARRVRRLVEARLVNVAHPAHVYSDTPRSSDPRAIHDGGRPAKLGCEALTQRPSVAFLVACRRTRRHELRRAPSEHTSRIWTTMAVLVSRGRILLATMGVRRPRRSRLCESR